VSTDANTGEVRYDYTNKYNKGEGGDFSVDEEHDQNRMLAKKDCVDRIRKDDEATYFSHLTERT
jgi:hypothetical protein